MAKKRLDKTLADYVVTAICPALIMTLVGSLVFFLMELSYRGQFESRMHWIMFWFVFAAVLVARIAIQEGHEHARAFGIAMGIAAAIAVLRFVDAVLVGWLLLGVVWWCSSKLTWDCTLIDESEDASGEGLLQAAGLEKVPATETEEPKGKKEPSKTDSSGKRKKKDKSGKKSKPTDAPVEKAEKTRATGQEDANPQTRPHSPGLWIVYFSLAALPLFGVGQLLIPAADAGRRSYTFQLLAVYVASAIALLLMTSFLGLRRYLRQRKLEMPAAMTASWLGMGTALLVALMLVAVVIPRPQGEYTLTAMIDKIDAKARQASKFAVMKGDRAEGEGRRIGEQDAKAKQAGEGQPPDQKKVETGENAKPGGTKSGNAKTGKPGDQDGKDGQKSKDSKSGGKQDKSAEKSDQKSDSDNKGDSKNKDASQANQKKLEEGQQQKKETEQGKKEPEQANDKKSEDQKRNPDQNQKPSSPKSPAAAADSMLSVMATWVGSFVKWIIYGLLAIVAVFFIVRHWSQFVEILAKLWAELLSLFGRQKKPDTATASDDQESKVLPKRPFDSFVNPFSTGAADRMSSPQLIRYTFEALEAWSREQDLERHPEQTPLEFADELGRRVPKLANDVAQTAQLYAQIAYARNVPSKERLEVLARLWRRLSA